METRIVLLTGGSAGIGLELSNLLMKKGIRVYSASRRLTEGRKSSSGEGEIIPVQMDVNNESDVNSVLDKIISENNRLDAIICNAGNGIAGSVEDTSIEEMRYQFETNFFGAVKTIQACLPIFRKQGHGKIMVTSSLAAIIPIPYQAFYSAGKSALFTFMQALCMEVEPFGIQCCTVLPGNAKTEFTNARKFTKKSSSTESAYKERMDKSLKNMIRDEENGMEAIYIARKMTTQLLKNRMKDVIVPGFGYQILHWIYNILPIRWRLWGISKIY